MSPNPIKNYLSYTRMCNSNEIRNFLSYFFLLFSIPLLCQTISVDDTSNSTEDLVDILIGNNCIPKSNFNISSNRSVAYFNNNSVNL